METEHPSRPAWVVAIESTLQISIAVMLLVLAVALVAKGVDAVQNAPAAATASRCASVDQQASACGWGPRAGMSPLLARNAGGVRPGGFYAGRRADCRWMTPDQRSACRQAAPPTPAP